MYPPKASEAYYFFSAFLPVYKNAESRDILEAGMVFQPSEAVVIRPSLSLFPVLSR